MSELQKHPVFWFTDGSIIFSVENRAFKVHKTLLSRHSKFFALDDQKLTPISPTVEPALDIKPHFAVDPRLGISAKDVEALLEHLYHDAPLLSETRFSQIISILRVSSPLRLDFPEIHALAKDKLNSLFPSGRLPFFRPDNPEEALVLATEYTIPSMRKALYYHFVTSPDSTPDPEATQSPKFSTLLPSDVTTAIAEVIGEGDPNINAPRRPLSQTDAKLCEQLMERLIDYFTPILFTPPATPHMACTDVFADTWMSLVIQPAIENDGVYKPLETLEQIKSIEWEKLGLCQMCSKEKEEEWTEEQEKIWRAMDGWLGLVTEEPSVSI
ncbi:hypothetical protein FPV67DRAFT_1050376 [Lyophyllum atratum]|nr:hypothetical protein FPV67DRAFT_1050376 [Lyophyllum atratum]